MDGEGSRAEQVETEGSKGLDREKGTKERQCRGKRMRGEGSTEYSNKHERQHQSKRRSPVRMNWLKRSAPSSLVENTEVKRRPHESCKWRKRPIQVTLPLGPGTRKITRREAADENQVLYGRSSLPRGETDKSISPTQQIAHQREASGNRKDKSIPDKSRRSRNSEEQE
ncbi:hypothetical protein NPIL_165021 [Nephila pilipes]|uniref:Uncharacterized protein n=1 Tax=Nephila pilipes TaxID=299642 RepID=A0A8X6N6U2_NEPPI|nr:hypothetical protein NPIL_165021 [Nephila pilipes]